MGAMRCAAFEDQITDAWSEALAFGLRITRAEVRRKIIQAAIDDHGYCVLQDDLTGEIFDAASGEPRPTWPEDFASAPGAAPGRARRAGNTLILGLPVRSVPSSSLSDRAGGSTRRMRRVALLVLDLAVAADVITVTVLVAWCTLRALTA